MKMLKGAIAWLSNKLHGLYKVVQKVADYVVDGWTSYLERMNTDRGYRRAFYEATAALISLVILNTRARFVIDQVARAALAIIRMMRAPKPPEVEELAWT